MPKFLISRSTANRLLATGLGTLLWIVVLKLIFPAFTVGHGCLLAIWIGIGSQHMARSLADYARPVGFGKLLTLGVLAPGWSFIYLVSSKHHE